MSSAPNVVFVMLISLNCNGNNEERSKRELDSVRLLVIFQEKKTKFMKYFGYLDSAALTKGKQPSESRGTGGIISLH